MRTPIAASARKKRRHTDNLGSVPLVRRWDPHEREHSDPIPYLFQYTAGPQRGTFSTSRLAKLLGRACAAAAKDRPEFEGLTFTPHDFRRIFATDLVNNGLPIHIGAALLGHANLQTTKGYVAVFDEDVVRHYQMHMASRRALRPDHEYAQVTNDEWEEFEEHFDKRKVELGACGRPYGTPCAHEHACVRCPMLHVEPRMILRLDELEADLTARRERAEQEGWKGEVDGLELPAGTTTYSHNTTGRLTGKTGASGSATYTYDADGNVTSDGANNYTWNAAGQLLTAGGAKPTKYTYDGDNRRASITNGNTVINPVWDPASGQLLAERDGNGKTLRGYTYGTGLVGMTAGAASYSYLTDAQGSVRAVVDAAGAPQWNYAYEPYGATRSAVAVSGRQAPTNPRQYLGAYVDGAAYDLSARQYLPGTGRFLSADPVASPGLGYVYGSANPMVYVDPFGMDDFEWLDIVHDVSTGVAMTAGSILIGCTLAVICAGTDVVTAPLAAFAGAVSWASDDNTGKCFSGKGGCAETVIFGALTAAGFGGLSTVARLGKAAGSTAASGMAGVRAAGRAGEAAAGIVKNTKRIPSATGTAEFRIPDELGNGILGEVKNVKSLTYTSQLQDFVAYAQANNLQFNLYVRQSTTFSGPLQGLINAGTITRVPSLGP